MAASMEIDTQQLRQIEIIIDGPNVAMAKAQATPHQPRHDAAAVTECATYFVQQGANSVKIYGPNGWCTSSPELLHLRDQGVLFCAPGGLDDQFMLDAADRKGSFIVSNDRYLDHSQYDTNWIIYHRIPFMHDPQFVADRSALDRIALYQNSLSPTHFDPGKARTAAVRGCEGSTAALQIDFAGGAGGFVGSATPAAALAATIAPQAAEHHQVPQSSVGRLIGKGGVTINAIRRSSGAMVHISDATDGVMAVVTLQGTAEARNAARAAIDKLLQTRPPRAAPPEELNEVFSVPRSVVGRLIGRGGANIMATQKASGARVVVNDDAVDPQLSQVTLRGTEVAVALARTEVDAIVAQFCQFEADNREPGAASDSDDGPASDL